MAKSDIEQQQQQPLSIPETSSIRDIRFLSCQGGGMKGIGDVGAIIELEKAGVIAQLEEVAGSSAGAIVATLIAAGCTASEIREEMLNLNFKELQDKEEPGWFESLHLKDIVKPLSNGAFTLANKNEVLSSFVKKVITLPEKVVTGIQMTEEIITTAFGNKLGLWKGDALTYLITRILARKLGNPNITFAELQALAKAPGSRVKKLTLTGSNITDGGGVEYFNAENSPNMPIALAVRISASFPGGYQPVKLVDEKGRETVHVDGGLLENLPHVFHKEPYLSKNKKNNKGGNAAAFALVFRSPEEKENEIKNGLDLAQALYATKMSEKPLYDMYGSNIAYIDTQGMGTLEFDASDDKRMRLAASGSDAVRKTFQTLLKAEATERVDYDALDDEALVRRYCRLKTKITGKPKEESQDYRELVMLNGLIQSRHLSDEFVKNSRQQIEAEIAARTKLTQDKALSDAELSTICLQRKLELERTAKQTLNAIFQLKTAKMALQLQRAMWTEKLQENRFNNDLYKSLQALKKLEEEIFSIRSKLVALDLEKEKGIITPREEKVRLKNTLEKLEKERKERMLAQIKLNQEKHDAILVNFFKMLLEDSRNPAFETPASRKALYDYGTKDITRCIGFIKEARAMHQKNKQELALFEQHQASFSQRAPRHERFETLLKLKMELDKTIYKNTYLLSKINAYLIEKHPRFKTAIAVTFQILSFLGCFLTSPLSLPVYLIAKGVASYSQKKGDRKTEETAQNVASFFALSNIWQDTKLRSFRGVLASFIKRIRENYTTADKPEETYLNKLLELYLKNSGLEPKELFTQGANETDKAFKTRIKQVEDRFTQWIPAQEKSKEATADVKAVQHNSSAFARGIQQEVARLEASSRIKLSISPKIKSALSANIALLNKEYVITLEAKFKRKENLSLVEIAEYIKSAKAIKHPLLEALQKQYEPEVEKMQKAQKTLQPREEAFLKADFKEKGKAAEALKFYDQKRSKKEKPKPTTTPPEPKPGFHKDD